jgi:hypothetical protein
VRLVGSKADGNDRANYNHEYGTEFVQWERFSQEMPGKSCIENHSEGVGNRECRLISNA